MTPRERLDRAIREAELARSDYFNGTVGDADYILRVLSLFTDVAGDAESEYRRTFAGGLFNNPDNFVNPGEVDTSKTEILRQFAIDNGIPIEDVVLNNSLDVRSNILPFTPRSRK